MDKKSLTETDIRTKYITPAIIAAGWQQNQMREEVYFTDGRIYVKGQMTARAKGKKADYILYYKPNIPIAIIEAKDNRHNLGDGMQQALEYAEILDIPFVFTSNGDGFLFHDKTDSYKLEKAFGLEFFPSPEELWQKYQAYKSISSAEQKKIVEQDYFFDGRGRTPRYYQQIAINRTLEAIAKGQKRVLLVMATGTGKTYTAYQIIYRLWKSGAKKRILFLADRTALIDQTRRGDFKHFRDKMTIIKKKVVSQSNGKDELISTNKRGIDNSDKAYEIFLGLYQGLTNSSEFDDAYLDFSPDFFDLVIIDECHRGSASDNSAWRRILDYFSSAVHIGLTATPKETDDISSSEYFGEPVYTYSLKQGINDGFLAPYKVIKVGLNIDLEGWRPPAGYLDKSGKPVEDRIYNRSDFDRNLVVEDRRLAVANKITQYLNATDRFAKTIVFCVDIEHAEGMRQYLTNANSDLCQVDSRYVMKITGDDDEGKRELDNFINPEEKYPVIATTSKLMTTGVDAQTCKLIVLDANIRSMTEFKQIIGRGTRINEEYGKHFFTILDFRSVTDLFADPDFDGDPVRRKAVAESENPGTAIDDNLPDEPVLDENGEEVTGFAPDNPPEEVPPQTDYPDNTGTTTGGVVTEPPRKDKVVVNGIDVTELNSREIYFDADGKPLTVSLKDHTKAKIIGKFRSLDNFLQSWQQSDKKELIAAELQAEGVLVDELLAAVGLECDLFDIVCHTAFDMPPLSRKERAENVKKRNYFTKYGDKARTVLEKLLDKYADEGIEQIEDVKVLQINPFTEFGNPLEIFKAFGGKNDYLKAVKELEDNLYLVG